MSIRIACIRVTHNGNRGGITGYADSFYSGNVVICVRYDRIEVVCAIRGVSRFGKGIVLTGCRVYLCSIGIAGARV